MADPDLDIVVVTHNSAAHIEATLASLGPGASVVVVDNASSDDSADRARRAGATVVESDTNAGFAASANRGARLGQAPLILFLNPDARIDRTDVARLTEALDADPALTIVSPRLVHPDGRPQRAAWPFPSRRRAWREALGLDRSGGADDGTGDVFVIGAALLVRRTAFEALQGFDERFWLYAEETDLCRRALDAGGRIGVVEDAVATHVGGASGSDQPDLVFDHFHRGVEHYIAKRDGRVGVVSIRAAMAVGSLVRAGAPGPDDRRDHHRRRLRHLARAALTSPSTVSLDNPATRARGKGLVVCSLEAWDDTWRRNQFFVRELLAIDPNRRVLFVEPPFDVVLEARLRRGRPRRRGLRPLDADGRVVRFEPSKLWPRVLGPFADRSLQRQVRRAARRLGFTEPSLWVNDPSYAGLLGSTRWPSLYDITDDWTEAGGTPRAAALVARFERALFAGCGAVVVCSEGLAASRRPLRPDLAVIPNAVDAEHFRAPRDRPSDLPDCPTAVYVGTLHEDRLDVELVERLAARDRRLSVVLVGPDALPADVHDRLRATPNVSLLGPRPYADVPAYLQHADVVIVPHVVSPFTESLDPIKAYECVAVGRPTVATPVAGFRDLPPPVVVAAGDAFVDAAVALADPRRPAEPGPVPTWSERGAAFDEQLRRSRSAGAGRRTKVVYVDHCAQLSGAEVALARLLPALDGVDAHVVLGEHGPLEARLAADGVRVEVLELDRDVASTHRDEVRVGALGVRRVVAAASDTIALARRLRALGPDLVETNSLKAALYGGLAARLAGVPVVWHVHDRIAADYLPVPVVWAVRGLARCLPNAVIANSDATRSTLGRRDAIVIPNPLPGAGAAVPAPPDRRPPGEPFRAVMVGRLAPWKGQDVFLRAFALAFPTGNERATIVGSALFGEDAYADSLEPLVAELGLTGRVELLGFRDDVDAVLAGSDVLVHASTTPEPFGQVIIEGMAAGIPVIASRGGGPSEIITDGEDGLLHPPGDAVALARLLTAVATDDGLRARLAAAGARRVRAFEPRAVADLVEETYAQVLERAGR